MNFLESFKNTEQPGDSYPFEYSYTATKRCFIVFCSVNPANRAYISGLKLKADLIPAGTDQNLSWSRPQENVFVRNDNLSRLAAEKLKRKSLFSHQVLVTQQLELNSIKMFLQSIGLHIKVRERLQ